MHHNNSVELLDADGVSMLHKETRSEIIERKIPVAVIILLVLQIIGFIWGAAVFHTQQENLGRQVSTNFEKVYQRMDKMEQSIYTRQEATVSLESIRQTNAKQDEDIRELNGAIKDILLRSSISSDLEDRISTRKR